MTTTYTFPILKELDVTPEIAYEIIAEGVEAIRTNYIAARTLKNDAEAFTLYDKIQKGERILRFIRVNTQVSNNLP